MMSRTPVMRHGKTGLFAFFATMGVGLLAIPAAIASQTVACFTDRFQDAACPQWQRSVDGKWEAEHGVLSQKDEQAKHTFFQTKPLMGAMPEISFRMQVVGRADDRGGWVFVRFGKDYQVIFAPQNITIRKYDGKGPVDKLHVPNRLDLNTWYDVGIVQTANGLVQVRLNKKLLASWQDASPSTEAAALSLGTRAVAVLFADFKTQWDLRHLNLPGVGGWEIGCSDGKATEFLKSGAKEFTFHVGQDDANVFPSELKPGQAVSVIFNLKEAGLYTLLFYTAGAKNVVNTYTISLNRDVLHKDFVVGDDPSYAGRCREAYPMDLEAGCQVLTIACTSGRGFRFDQLSLVKGDSKATYEPLPEVGLSWNQKYFSEDRGSISGKDFYCRFTVSNGSYTVRVAAKETVTAKGWAEPLYISKGKRIFDVHVNNQLVLEDLDAFAAQQEKNIDEYSFPVDVQDGCIEIHCVAKKDKARLSWVRILDRQENLVGEIQGHVDASVSFHFDGTVNLVPNPGFEFMGGEKTLPAWWKPLNTPGWWKTTAGQGEICSDHRSVRAGRQALRLSSTSGEMGMQSDFLSKIDQTLTYTFSGWMKTRHATGSTYLELIWYRDRMRPNQDRGVRLVTEEIGRTSSRKLRGDHDWRLVAISAKPPRGAHKVSFALRSDDNAGTAWFDQLHFDGGGNEPVKLLDSQAGYTPHGKKEIMIFTIKPVHRATVELFDRKDASSVFQASLRYLGRQPWKYDNLVIADSLWNRHVYLADLSSFAVSGDFELRLDLETADGEKHHIDSHPVSIRESLYLDLAKLTTTGFFRTMRCGCSVPGWHPACHLDDAVRRVGRTGEQGEHISAAGGWHDAGDYDKFTVQMGTAIYALTTLYQKSKPAWDAYGDRLPDVLAEAAWGIKGVLPLQCEAGNFCWAVELIRNGGVKIYFQPPDQDTDNLPDTADDRTALEPYLDGSNLMIVYPIAKFAWVIRDFDNSLSDRCLSAAKKGYRYYEKHVENKSPADDPSVIIAATYLHRLTDRQDYLETAAARVSDLLELFRNDQIFTYFDYARRGSGSVLNFDFLFALYEFAQNFPGHPLVPEIKDATRAFMENHMRRLTSQTVFGHMVEFKERRPRNYLHNNSFSTYLPCAGYAMALAAEMLAEPAYLEMAERQAQWMLGRNPCGVCLVDGVGHREQVGWTCLGSIEGHFDGKIPGAVGRGLRAGTGVAGPLRSAHGRSGYVGAPLDFLAIRVADPSPPSTIEDVAYGDELYEVHAAAFILLCEQIHRMREAERETTVRERIHDEPAASGH